jgi:hypothetical protein
VLTASGYGTCGLLGLMLKLMEGTHLGSPEQSADGISDHALHAVNVVGAPSVLAQRVRALRLAPADGAAAPIGVDGEFPALVAARLPGRCVEVVSYPNALRLFMLPPRRSEADVQFPAAEAPIAVTMPR